jgi:amphi-Trp domain-containing protein
MGEKRDRDVERVYTTSEFVAKLRRLADALEADERFEIQVAGERVYVPVRAEFNVEHEREGNEE